MKFELKPDNRNLGDDVLLDDLRDVARRLCKGSVTRDEYNEYGKLSAATFLRRFGSWSKAHELAGLQTIPRYGATAEDCINGLKRVAEKLGKIELTVGDYKPHGRFSSATISRRCGSFKDALRQAGLEPSRMLRERLTEEQLFDNLERVWEALGRQPTRDYFSKPLSCYSSITNARRFGSFRKALEAFVNAFESAVAPTNCSEFEVPTTNSSPDDVSSVRHKTPRGVSWRVRFLVMRRDDFKCRICGVSPALKPGTILVIDHVLAWEAGGETVLENLQTLCEPCNGGKSNLPLAER